MKKIKKNIWEKVLVYPSFNTRFVCTLGMVLFIFFGIGFIIFMSQYTKGTSDQIAILNLLIQSATLVLGIFAAYYALRQLVETRFTSLDEAGSQEIKRQHYSRAFYKWKEAFYIRPEAAIFNSLCETLLLIGDFDTFDEYIKIPEDKNVFKKEIFQESSDQIILCYLKSIRYLLVKNQGEAEKHLSGLIDLAKKEGLSDIQWDFLDLRTSLSYQDLNGECKKIAENLISYLSKTMSVNRKIDFENKNFTSELS